MFAEQLGVVTHHLAGRVGLAGQLQRPSAADAALAVGPPDLFARRIEDPGHRRHRPRRQQGHTAGEITHLARTRRTVHTGQITVATLIGDVAHPVARIESQRIEVDAHGALLGTTPAHQAVVGRLAAQHAVTAVTQEVDRLHGADVEHALQLAGVDADAAARAGLDLETVERGLLLARTQPVAAQEDERDLGKDVHVARERQCHEEEPEAGGVEPPGSRLEVHQRQHADVCRHPSAERTGQEAPAAVQRAGRALGQQACREDEPQGRQGDAVAQDVFRRAAHAHSPRAETLAPGQGHAREDKEQQQVHQKVEDGLVFESRGEILEEDVTLQGHVTEPEVGHRLDPAHRDQEEPAEGQRHVHVAQQGIDAEDPPVEERLADDLPRGLQRAPRGQSAQDQHLVGPRQAVEPRSPLPEEREEHHGRAGHEGYAERSEEVHGQKSPSLRLMSITTPRVLIPRGQTSRHLPHSMHLFISS